MRMRGAARTGTDVGGDFGRRQGNRAGIALRVSITRSGKSPIDVGRVISAAFTMRPTVCAWQAAVCDVLTRLLAIQTRCRPD